MLDQDVEWKNFRWGIDVSYVHMEECPLLSSLVEKYKRFWDGQYHYKRQATFILRWPDWRKKYRVELERWNRHHKKDINQKKILQFVTAELFERPSNFEDT